MTKKMSLSRGCIPSVLKQKMKLLVVAAALVSGGLQAQVVEPTITTPGTGTWTVPAGAGLAKVECWGGGGAGGSAESTQANATGTIALRGGGGAGGSYAKKNIAVTPGQGLNYTVGAGALPTVIGSANASFSNGANTTFASYVLANGGTGGQGRYATANNMTLNASGAIANTTGNIGDVIYNGGSGSSAVTLSS